MDTQMKKGLLDAYVLAIVNKDETYGYKIVQEANNAISLTESTLYPILRRLEKQVLLETHTEEYNSRLRKYYRITGEGKAKLHLYKEQWKDIKLIMDEIFKMGEGETA